MADERDPVAEAFRAAARDARVPSAGLMWWRMQLRAKREAEAAAVRTVTRVQWIVPALVLAFGLVVLGATGAWAGLGVSWGAPLLLAGAAACVLAPVAVWLAVTRE
ncbi:MAG TPA: hypothetical protein VF139_05530 [Candidatus Polarisedimenticolaceae bacterium]